VIPGCRHCGYAGRPRWANGHLAVLAALLWLVPLGFLVQGFYPFLIVPAMAVTVWAVMAVRRTCPSCGRPWRG